MTMPEFEPVAWFNPLEDLSDEAFSWHKDTEQHQTVRVFDEDQFAKAYEAGKRDAAPQVEQEPVYYEYRAFFGDNTVTPGWGEWERVKARDALCTVEDAVNELEEYIAAGYKYQLRRLYTAPPTPAVPDGWKLVPIEPTEEMLTAGERESDSELATCETVFEAMIAAAPEPPK